MKCVRLFGKQNNLSYVMLSEGERPGRNLTLHEPTAPTALAPISHPTHLGAAGFYSKPPLAHGMPRP